MYRAIVIRVLYETEDAVKARNRSSEVIFKYTKPHL